MMDVSKLLDLRIGRISVDIDVTHRWDAVDLIFSLLKVRKYFDKYAVRVSSSKRGFHIIIYKDVNAIENILWRGYLYDDSNRIKYCLSRIAMALLKGRTPTTADVDLLFVSKRSGVNKPFKHATPINIKEIFGDKLERWEKMKPSESIKEINEFLDEFAEKLGISEVYIVYGKINDDDVELIQKVKRYFMNNTKWKLTWMTDPYDGTKVLAKVDVTSEEEAKEVEKLFRMLGIKQVWYIKRRF